jgi:hypothetical protein
MNRLLRSLGGGNKQHCSQQPTRGLGSQKLGCRHDAHTFPRRDRFKPTLAAAVELFALFLEESGKPFGIFHPERTIWNLNAGLRLIDFGRQWHPQLGKSRRGSSTFIFDTSRRGNANRVLPHPGNFSAPARALSTGPRPEYRAAPGRHRRPSGHLFCHRRVGLHRPGEWQQPVVNPQRGSLPPEPVPW